VVTVKSSQKIFTRGSSHPELHLREHVHNFAKSRILDDRGALRSGWAHRPTMAVYPVDLCSGTLFPALLPTRRASASRGISAPSPAPPALSFSRPPTCLAYAPSPTILLCG